MVDNNNFSDLEKVAAKERLENHADFNGELRGGESRSRTARFFTDDNSPAREKEKRKKRAAQSLLQKLLQSASYAKVYREVGQALDSAQDTAQEALDLVNERLETVNRQLLSLRHQGKDTQDNADYQRLLKQQIILQDYRTQITQDQAEYSAIRSRMNDPENPYTEKKLRSLSTDVAKKENDHLEIINELEKPSKPLNLSAAKDIMGDSPLNAPEICRDFDNARCDIPHSKTTPTPAVNLDIPEV